MKQIEPGQPTKLLVSARNRSEAIAAVQGGADIIDIKEPVRGSLGAADSDVIAEILQAIHDRPVTAALGELVEARRLEVEHYQLAHIKLGLANASKINWQQQLAAIADQHEGLVAVAYADHERVDAPSLEEVLNWVFEHEPVGLLIDTAVKDGRTLLDYIDVTQIADMLEALHESEIFLALAGSLDLNAIEKLSAISPDVIAVRSAACENANRDGCITAAAVASCKQAIAGHKPAASHCADSQG